MRKILCLLCSLALVISVLPLGVFAEKTARPKTVELYGRRITTETKQICFVKGTEEEDGFYSTFYDDSFKNYCYVGNATIDFKVIAEKLPKLQNLVVIRSDVTNLSALKELNDLKWLGLHQCDGSENLSFLKNLTGLTKFRYTDVYGEAECESINPVSFLKNLNELYLYVKASAINDITVLKGLTKLKNLDLRYVGGDDVAVIKRFKNLKELTLKLSDTTDMSFLSKLTKLEKLDISGDTKNIKTAARLKKLKSLDIDSSEEDLSFIGEMNWLEELSLSYVGRSFTQSVGKLKNLKSLALLDINNGGSYDTSFLKDLKGLEELMVFGNPNLEISGISKLKKLKYLSIMLCKFKDLSELKNCKALEELTIYNNNSSFDIKWIEGSNIKDLRISDGADGGIKNMEKLGTLKSMTYLLLDFTGISDETAKAIKKAVPKCKIEVCELGYGDYNTTFY